MQFLKDTFPGLDIKRKNRTDETSIKLQEDGMWREQPIRTTLDWAREKNGKVTKQDTDYRFVQFSYCTGRSKLFYLITTIPTYCSK